MDVTRSIPFVLLLLVVVASTGQQAASGQLVADRLYTVRGSDPNFPDSSFYPIRISGDGTTIVGNWRIAGDPEYRAARWTKEGDWQNAGSLPGDYSLQKSAGLSAVSSDGGVAVGSSNRDGDRRAIAWTQATGLIDLTEAYPLDATGAIAVSGDGNWVAGRMSSSTYRLDRQGGNVESIESGFVIVADGISGDGSVLVGNVAGQGGPVPHRWDAGTLSSLSYLPGGDYAGAVAVSADGSTVVGRANDAGGEVQVVYWKGGNIVGLGQETDNIVATSTDGLVIVGTLDEGGYFLWTPQGITPFADVLDGDSCTPGWTVISVQDISDDGRTFLIRAGDPEGVFDWWRVTLSESASKAPPECGCTKWSNASGGAFFEANNWETTSPPDADVCVRFDVGSTYSVSFSDNAETDYLSIGGDLLTLQLNGHTYAVSTALGGSGGTDATPALEVASAGESGTLIIRDGILLVETAFVNIGDGGGLGKLVISQDGRLEVPYGSGVFFEIGNSATSSGGLLIEAGGQFNTPYATLTALEAGSVASIEVKGANSMWVGAQVTLAENGSGELIVHEGGAVDLLGLTLAANQNSHADLLVHGDSSFLRIQNGGQLTVGAGGQATLIVEAAGDVIMDGNNLISIGDESGSSGEITLTDGASWTGEGNIVVGDNGQGLLTINEAANASFRSLEIALYDGVPDSVAESRVMVSDPGTTLNLGTGDETILVGVGGPATMEISSGGNLLVDGNLMVGAAPIDPQLVAGNSRGRFVVSGSGTEVLILGALALGDQNQGEVLISDGATVSTNETRIGFFSLALPPMNTVEVVDDGTTLSAPWLFVGEDAPGTLTIGPGAIVVTSNLSLGATGFISGTVLTVGQANQGSKRDARADAGLYADTLYVAEGATLVVDSVRFGTAAVLGGSAWPAAFTNTGTLSPGNRRGTTSTFTVDGDYVQTETGSLLIDVGAQGHDALATGDTATLGGTLKLSYIDGYSPRIGDKVEIVAAGSVIGSFDSLSTPTGDLWTVSYSETNVVIEAASVLSSEDELKPEDQTVFALDQNYPNPFSSSTQIRYDVVDGGPVELSVFDALGREVAVLVNAFRARGRYVALFEAGSLPSGLYICRLKAGGDVRTKSMLLLR